MAATSVCAVKVFIWPSANRRTFYCRAVEFLKRDASVNCFSPGAVHRWQPCNNKITLSFKNLVFRNLWKQVGQALLLNTKSVCLFFIKSIKPHLWTGSHALPHSLYVSKIRCTNKDEGGADSVANWISSLNQGLQSGAADAVSIIRSLMVQSHPLTIMDTCYCAGNSL